MDITLFSNKFCSVRSCSRTAVLLASCICIHMHDYTHTQFFYCQHCTFIRSRFKRKYYSYTIFIAPCMELNPIIVTPKIINDVFFGNA